MYAGMLSYLSTACSKIERLGLFFQSYITVHSRIFNFMISRRPVNNRGGDSFET